MTHDIRIQAWGTYAVVACTTCTRDNGVATNFPTVLAKSDGVDGVLWADAVAAIERHTGEGAFRLGVGQRVEGQVEFSAQEDLVASGPVDDYRAPGVSRTGQRLPEQLRIDTLEDYARQKGEL